MPDRDQSHTSNRGFASMEQQKQREIASKGGQASGGNFKNDPARAAEAGRKGGHDLPAEQRSFSKDRELAAEAGRRAASIATAAGAPARVKTRVRPARSTVAVTKPARAILPKIANAPRKPAAKAASTATTSADSQSCRREPRAARGSFLLAQSRRG